MPEPPPVRPRRVAIITGASSGIGRALTERAVRAGWDVFAVGRRVERLRELETLLAHATGRIATLTLDLRTPGAAKRIVREALERFGGIDVLVNNAGGVAVGAISEQSDGELYEQFETHVIVPLALTREALPSLRERKGLVVYFGSGVARIPVTTLGAYPPAKAAVRSLARIARNELRADGIAVTYVDPGAVATEFMTRAGFSGPPPALAASPYDVARAVFAAFTHRRAVVNAVPWQTFFVALGEALPAITDAILRRAPEIVGGERRSETLPLPTAAPPAPDPTVPPVRDPSLSLAPPSPLPANGNSPFERALEPYLGRMAKLRLRVEFIRELLEPGRELDVADVAMRWAGMPNKHERALTADLLAALADATFLERQGDDRYRVTAAAER